MYAAMTTLLDRLDLELASHASVIPWGCPVPCFGDLSTARVATVGINPSNREFVDGNGTQLTGSQMRLPTLQSFGLTRWSEATSHHLQQIIRACQNYFRGNPYDRWFNFLEQVVSGLEATYYKLAPTACHLDLVPYATTSKWGTLTSFQRQELLDATGDALGLLLENSSVRLLILNGRSVVDNFERIADVSLDKAIRNDWGLHRVSGRPVQGIAYFGQVSEIGGVQLSQSITVAGYNHNLQSSYGVTGDVISRISEWLSEFREIVFYEAA